MARIETSDCIVEYADDKATKNAVFDAVLAFFTKHELYSAESLAQRDITFEEAPNLLGTLADNVFGFQVTWKDE